MSLALNDLNELELENIGAWPQKIKVAICILVAVLIFILGYHFVISKVVKEFRDEKKIEIQLRNDYQMKYQMAVNLPLYQEQIKKMQLQFAELLEMLPTKNEISELLDDLTFVANNSGLKIISLNWQQKIEKDFYIEFPINMSVTGNYHQMGKMLEAMAGLPRMVSLSDFKITQDKSGLLRMDMLAKTYRFKDKAQFE